ncbi:hypothetical protein JOQ06_005243, partial [Pogonophryne albipinna]
CALLAHLFIKAEAPHSLTDRQRDHDSRLVAQSGPGSNTDEFGALLYGPASPVWCAGERAPPETRRRTAGGNRGEKEHKGAEDDQGEGIMFSHQREAGVGGGSGSVIPYIF